MALLAACFALAVAAAVLVPVVFDVPGWAGPAVAGGIIGLAGAVIITRLLRER